MKTHKCGICGQAFPSTDEFKAHVLSHTTITNAMLGQLQEAQLHTGFNRAFTLLGEAMIAMDNGIRHWARKAVKTVIEHVGESKTKDGKRRIAEALSPIATVCINSEDPGLRRYAVQALDDLAVTLGRPSSYLFYLKARLSDEDPEVAAEAAKVLDEWSQ